MIGRSDLPMSYPYQPPYATAGYAPQSQAENTLGLVGFICSLVGLVFCIAAPVGLVLSLMGLRREPKGLAIAGTIIGGLTTLSYLAILAFYGAVIAACIGIGVAAQPELQTRQTLNDARSKLEQFQGEDGTIPGQAEGDGILQGLNDYWKRPLRYEPQGKNFVLRSAGPDGKFDTSDDIVLDSWNSSGDFSPSLPAELPLTPEAEDQPTFSTEPAAAPPSDPTSP